MKQKRAYIQTVFAAAALLVLILDGKTAVSAGAEAVNMCIRVLIPSLFPFFVFSPLLTSGMTGKIRALSPLRKLLRLPEGSESILVVSFLGGYPVGAAAVAHSCRKGDLQEEDARRMLAFCNNAGPSFLFGIGAQLFPNVWYCWLIWLIHITSALLVGILTPGGGGRMKQTKAVLLSMTNAIHQGIRVMATVCSWVVLFRILIGFLDRWVFWTVRNDIRTILCGILELANGCYQLGGVQNVGYQLTLFSVFIGFGGLCVWLQTRSVADGVDASLYLPGKITQTAFSILLCSAAQVLLPSAERYFLPLWVLFIAITICIIYPIFLAKSKKISGNLRAVGV